MEARDPSKAVDLCSVNAAVRVIDYLEQQFTMSLVISRYDIRFDWAIAMLKGRESCSNAFRVR